MKSKKISTLIVTIVLLGISQLMAGKSDVPQELERAFLDIGYKATVEAKPPFLIIGIHRYNDRDCTKWCALGIVTSVIGKVTSKNNFNSGIIQLGIINPDSNHVTYNEWWAKIENIQKCTKLKENGASESQYHDCYSDHCWIMGRAEGAFD